MIDVEDFIDGYIECALWADCMPAPEYFCACGHLPDEHIAAGCTLCECESYVATDLAADIGETGGGEHLELRPGAREKMAVDCRAFCEENAEDLALYCEQRSFDPSQGSVSSYAGHDFWLTRQRHGTGFWDRGLGELGDRLTDAAHSYGSADDHTPFDCGDGTADV